MSYRLTKEGKEYLSEGLPEWRLLKLISENDNFSIEDAQQLKRADIAISQSLRRKLVNKKDGKLTITEKGKELLKDDPYQNHLKSIDEGNDIPEEIIEELERRTLIEEIKYGDEERAEELVGKDVTIIEPALLRTGKWRDVNLVSYDVTKIPEKIESEQTIGRKHILEHFRQKLRNIFFDMGFKEMKGPIIESSFWNFETLFIPQDHPAREMQDTFFMSTPAEMPLPEKQLVEAVKNSHEMGTKGSKGWGYKWSETLAKQAVLRTHTTSVSVRTLSEIRPPAKIFGIDRVFRNEAVDYKHLPEFQQVEGLVLDENANFKDLLGYLKEFYYKLGFEKIRFRPAYFPYTEMSVEPEVWHPERKEWIELGGAGIFRPEVTEPLGINVPVLAWGLGLERPVMLALELNDLRDFYFSNDLELLRNAPIKE